jgi:Rrf2 family cysteine metabolism transcriptional repressor
MMCRWALRGLHHNLRRRLHPGPIQMMKLSTRSSYGLRAALTLAFHHGESPRPVAKLAEENGIPRRYLEQILNRLRRAGLVTATRGPGGGYGLARESGRITVGDIVRAVEGELEPVLCAFPEFKAQGVCVGEKCFCQAFCQEIERTLTRILDGTTLADFRARALRCREDSTGTRHGTEILSRDSLDSTH